MEHIIERRIYYHDTDAGGVVYYSSYFKHFEEGRDELFLSRGLNLKDLGESDVYFIVASLQAAFRAPAFYHDVVRVATRVERIGTSSVVFRQEIRRADRLLVEATTTVVCVNGDFKPRRVPPGIRQAIMPGGPGPKEAS